MWFYFKRYLCSFTARSISEEFSSGDTRNRDNDEPAAQSGTHSRDSRAQKERGEDRDEGITTYQIFACIGSLKKHLFRPRIIHLPCAITEMIKVYDGNISVRRRIFRVINVPRQASIDQVLTIALRAFHITKDLSTSQNSKFFIIEFTLTHLCFLYYLQGTFTWPIYTQRTKLACAILHQLQAYSGRKASVRLSFYASSKLLHHFTK